MDKISENKAQVLICFIVFLLIISLGIAGFYFISYAYEKKNRQELETRLAMVEERKDKLEKQIEEITKEKLSLEEKVKEDEKIIPELQEKLDIETQAKELLINEHESLQNEITQLEQERKDTKVALNMKIQEMTQLQVRLNALILERDELRSRLAEVSFARERQGQGQDEDLEKIVVKPDSFKRTKPALSTEVISVNKEYGFVVLNAGIPEGVGMEDVFEVFHKDTLLGYVRVKKIHDTISAADFLEGFKKDRVSEGDRATRVN